MKLLVTILIASLAVACGPAFTLEGTANGTDAGAVEETGVASGDTGPSDPSDASAAADVGPDGPSAIALSDGGDGGLVEAGPLDAGPATVCLSTLSGIGTGNFTIAFTLTTTSAAVGASEAGASLALAAQRPAGCVAGDYWDINLNAGRVVAQIENGTHNVVLQPNVLADDGQPHRVVFSRIAGEAQCAVDATSTTTSDSDSYGAFPALTTGSENGCATPLTGYGTVSDVCISIP